ncbi:MAG: chromosome segregation ATPase [Cyanobacteria bacterium J06600_6]
MSDINQQDTVVEQWCLVTIRQWKRESFVKYLQTEIDRQKLEDVILEIIEPEEAVYDNMILLRIASFPVTRKILMQIEFFQGIQRLKPQEAQRMLAREA